MSHLGYIDALRGMAFLGVLLVHSGLRTGSPTISQIVLGGEYGVQLFFLLSAITLFRSQSVRGSGEMRPLRNYFIRRFFRIAPLFWFGIALYYWLEGPAPRPVAPAGLHFWHYAVTAVFLHGWAPTSFNSVVPGGWSIAVEMTFYLCLPFLVRRVPNLWTALVGAFAALVTGVILGRIASVYLARMLPDIPPELIADLVTHWFPAQLCVFLLGAAVYHLLRDDRASRFLAAHPARPLGLVAVGTYGIIALASVDSGDWLPIHALYAVAFVPFIIGLAVRPFRWFVNPVTRVLGTLSYSGYLTHFAALQAVDAGMDAGWFAAVPSDAVVTRFALMTVSALLLTVIFSTVTYWLIERPGISLGKWVIARGERDAINRAASTDSG